MTTHHYAVEMPTQTIVELALEELQRRVIALEIEVAHWERTCQELSTDLRVLTSARRHCQAERTVRRNGGQPR